MPTRTTRLRVTVPFSVFLVVALIVAACGGSTATPFASVAQSSGPSTSSSPPASLGPTAGAIEHATGATDVILRLDQGGGLVPIEFLATQAPTFTLFGNGIVVFRQTATAFPQPDVNGVVKGIPWRTATLDEGQIQELLQFALGVGGLGTARGSYPANGVADAPDTIFTIRAGGVAKTVVVNALGIDTQAGPDSIARAAFATLAARLADFDRGGSIGSDVYHPDRDRGILTEREGGSGGALLAWPWPAIKPTDFKPGATGGNGGPALPHRTMTADEIAALELTGIEGGVQGLSIQGPDGKSYGFILRPLLADETE